MYDVVLSVRENVEIVLLSGGLVQYTSSPTDHSPLNILSIGTCNLCDRCRYAADTNNNNNNNNNNNIIIITNLRTEVSEKMLCSASYITSAFLLLYIVIQTNKPYYLR